MSERKWTESPKISGSFWRVLNTWQDMYHILPAVREKPLDNKTYRKQYKQFYMHLDNFSKFAQFLFVDWAIYFSKIATYEMFTIYYL